jgi:putative glutamine amidotransferase
MGHGTFYRYALSRTYVDAIRAAAGVPVILPTDQLEFDEILPRLDGLLLSGGGDISPPLYRDDTIHDTTYGIDDERDSFEIGAFRQGKELDLPVLCICRGIQVMAVAEGGTLWQDIPTQIGEQVEHRQQRAGKMRDDLGHSVEVKAGTPLHRIVGADTVDVNSFHHQSVKDPGPSLKVAATAADGVIEALYHPDMRFGIGVQWHPEMIADKHHQHAAIFTAFVNAAAR